MRKPLYSILYALLCLMTSSPAFGAIGVYDTPNWCVTALTKGATERWSLLLAPSIPNLWTTVVGRNPSIHDPAQLYRIEIVGRGVSTGLLGGEHEAGGSGP